MKKYFYVLLLIPPLIFNACSSAVRYVSETSEENNSTDNVETGEEVSEDLDYNNYRILETEEGVASYYADKFHGKPTASGEIYNMNGISAAHINYPFGTIVKVTNLSNDHSIILRINDRMPDLNGRIIDLSLGAAKNLDMINNGIAKVRIDVLKWGR